MLISTDKYKTLFLVANSNSIQSNDKNEQAKNN